MINEVGELSRQYKLLQQELNLSINDNNNIDNYNANANNSFNKLKLQLSQIFLNKLLNYIKKYRRDASPNKYFMSQFIDIIPNI